MSKKKVKPINIEIPEEISGEEERKLFEKTEHKIPYKHLKISKRSRLGSGSSGQVIKVFYNKRPYALKILNYGYDTRPSTVLNEIRSLQTQAEKKCPFVIKMHEAFHVNGSIRILLEYMDCGSLRDIIKYVPKKIVPERILSLITYQILKGLEFLEHVKIIHRDIKPSNILINHNGKVRIADFGLSKILSNSQIASFSFKGTFIYMSPQRISGEKIRYNSDIWSLGVSLLELAIGMFPFDLKEVDHFTYLPMLKKFHYMNLSKFGLSDEFLDFFKKCTIYDHEHRQNAATLLKHKFITKHFTEDFYKEIAKFLKKNYIDIVRAMKKKQKDQKKKKKKHSKQKQKRKEKE